MRLTLSVHYFDQGDLDRAKQAFTDLSEAELSRDHRLMVGFYLANTHYSLREFNEARASFEDLLREYPQARALPDILFGLAESHYQLGEFESAIGQYQRILAEYPRDTTADHSQYNMAWCLIELKREEESMVAFHALLEGYPQSEFAPSAQFTLADDAYNRRSYEEAIRGYRLVQERYPENSVAAKVPRLISEIEEAMAYVHYGLALALMDSAEVAEQGIRQKEYFERAISSFREISARFPGTESELGALSNMGVCLEGLRQWHEAIAVYDQVIEMYEEKRASKEVFQFVKAHKDWIVTTRL
jgi:TolA-binding protein